MPRGGPRSGAGRKPGGQSGGVVLGMDGERRLHRAASLPPAVSPEEQEKVLEPPDELPADAKACWRVLAPRALLRHTLTDVEIAGFSELCLRQARVRALDIRIDQLGAGSQEALPYLRERRGAAVLLNASLKDFKLTAFGKPVVSEKPVKAANPFGQVAG